MAQMDASEQAMASRHRDDRVTAKIVAEQYEGYGFGIGIASSVRSSTVQNSAGGRYTPAKFKHAQI